MERRDLEQLRKGALTVNLFDTVTPEKFLSDQSDRNTRKLQHRSTIFDRSTATP